MKSCTHFDFFSGSCDDPLGSGLVDANRQLTRTRLWITQFYALLVKRLHYIKGKLVAVTVQNVFPLAIICLSLLIARFLQTVPNPPPLELSPHLFFAKSHYNYLFTGGYYTEETAPMIDSIFQPCGVAAHSVGSSMCYRNFTSAQCTDDANYPQVQSRCTCPSCEIPSFLAQNESFHLPFSGDIPPCYNGTVSGSRVQNLTLDYDPSAADVGYYSLHNYLLRSRDSFVEKRYGGLSFGHFKTNVSAKVDELNSDSSSTLPFLATHSAAKVWYTFKGYHAMPAYLNTMNNAILRGIINNSQSQQSEYGKLLSGSYDCWQFDSTLSFLGIRTISHPFNLTDLEKSIYAVT